MTTPLEGPLADSDAGLWITELLAPPGTVTGTVPGGFEAYARIFHPIHAQLMSWDQDYPEVVESRRLLWSELAQERGTVAHPLMQWDSVLAGYRNPVWNEPGWQYEDPLVGSLATGSLAEVARILAGHTSTPEECLAGLWEGWGWVSGAEVRHTVGTDGRSRTEPASPPFGETGVFGAARLELPGRKYLLFNAGLSLFADPRWQEASGWDGLQSPNLLWPKDRQWFLATEIDFDSTLVGGSAALIDALVQSDVVECLAVPPDGDLTQLGDLLNERPD
ncbi:hypothetical protein [Arthrobacter sp. zg-Y1143]|uniref:hypothetical protein n=1 Tax=Arthrobacter sp. zg-Y1143 TaxID=3049065 RepID=UPI0024C20EA5|nr:hypothetical protein [Arthrobacter sp. zg-Y1143]MDK1327666.1 hypothetical protein [Arthrobacter sp. zg-Y1143]